MLLDLKVLSISEAAIWVAGTLSSSYPDSTVDAMIYVLGGKL
jgi:hypothetical protein